MVVELGKKTAYAFEEFSIPAVDKFFLATVTFNPVLGLELGGYAFTHTLSHIPFHASATA